MSIERPKLFPFQISAVQWLMKRKTALLSLDMGLGKTAVSIRAADLSDCRRIAVICPASVRVNWIREFEKWSDVHRDFVLIDGKDVSTVSDSQSLVCSYDLATIEAIQGAADRGRFDLLILDESQYLKSVGTKRTEAVLKRGGLVHKSDRVWCLSGTPAPNHAGELWPILFTFGVTQLAYDAFIEKFCTYYVTGKYGAKRITGTNTEMIPELREMLSRIMYRRRKEDVMLELPPISYDDVVVEPGKVDLETEASFVGYVFPIDRRAELFAKLERERTIIQGALATVGLNSFDAPKVMSVMADSVSTLRRYTGIQKIEGTAKLIASELLENKYEKVVIFAIHQAVIEGLREFLAPFGAVTLYGNTPLRKRQINIDKFQKNKKCRVFIGNIVAAGTGLTLTAANQVVFVEQDWVPGNNAQAAMRCHRIGQENPVFVRFVGLANSIDEKIAQVLKRKTKELTAIFDLH